MNFKYENKNSTIKQTDSASTEYSQIKDHALLMIYLFLIWLQCYYLHLSFADLISNLKVQQYGRPDLQSPECRYMTSWECDSIIILPTDWKIYYCAHESKITVYIFADILNIMYIPSTVFHLYSSAQLRLFDTETCSASAADRTWSWRRS